MTCRRGVTPTMRIAKRKSGCAGCRGLQGTRDPTQTRCAYGFAVGLKEIDSRGLTKSGKISVPWPLEPCPRPRSYDEHIDAAIYEQEHRLERRAARHKAYEKEEERELAPRPDGRPLRVRP